MAADGYTWTGTLEETDIQSLYAACQSLRFSGKLELREGAIRAEVTFVGGEPIEIDGGDTQRIALWNKGTFRAVQSIPNLAGELTGQREMEGSLAITKASALWAWISEYRLTCDIDLERPGSKAVVSFSNGHAESAQVNGMPELAALARVSSWTDGSFRVKLKPLFVDGALAAAPLIHEGAPPAGRQFDVSRSIPMDIKLREQAKVLPQATFGPPKSALPTPPLGELALHQPPGRDEPTAAQRSLSSLGMDAGGKKRGPFDPVESSQGMPRVEPEVLAPGPKRSRLPWLMSLGGIVLAGGLGALYYNHLPPFSPPPKPIVEPAGSGVTVKPSGGSVAPSGESASGATVKPSGGSVAPSGQAAIAVPPVKPSGETVASGVAVKPTRPEVAKVEPKKPEPPKEKVTDKLVAKGRLLLIEGHGRAAMDQFHHAVKLAPKDASLKVYEQQATGKLGKAELLLEGKGAITVDGYKFPSPRKIKLMAGPHSIDAGDGEDEVTLKRGEKRRVKVKK
jgi:hypothetical protein